MEQQTTSVAIVGLGRVGLPLALVLSEAGHRVRGVDHDPSLLANLDQKRMPFREPGCQELLDKHGLDAESGMEAISETEYVIITVGTPLRQHIETNLDHIRAVFASLLKHVRPGQTILLRSTVSPGTCTWAKRYIEANTNLTVGEDIFLAYCPERIAEGKAIEELHCLPQIIGAEDEHSASRAERFFRTLVDDVFLTSFSGAELSKLFCNISRYVYFAVSNFFMMVADELGANIHEILSITNHKYPRQIIAKPGFTAGTCLRKDFGMLNEHIPYVDLLLSAWKINEYIPHFIEKHISQRLELHNANVAILGYTFKRDTDDLRDSLSPKLMRYIQRKVPASIRICEPNLPVNREIEPGIHNQDLRSALAGADVVIFAVNHSAFERDMDKILDLCGDGAWVADIWNITGTGNVFFQLKDRQTNENSGNRISRVHSGLPRKRTA